MSVEDMDKELIRVVNAVNQARVKHEDISHPHIVGAEYLAATLSNALVDSLTETDSMMGATVIFEEFASIVWTSALEFAKLNGSTEVKMWDCDTHASWLARKLSKDLGGRTLNAEDIRKILRTFKD